MKANLQWYTAILLAGCGLLFFAFVLPTDHQEKIISLFKPISSSEFFGYGTVTLVFGFLGWLLIFALEIHDKVYDRYLTRWRHYYDLDFILPTLVRPFTHKLDPRFFRVAETNLYQFMKPFYHFVADYEHEHKIRENLAVRFYEVVTKYWISQINELIMFFFLLLSFAYYLVYRSLGIPLDPLLITTFILAALFLVNRYAVRRSRETVRLATADEIEDIHDRYLTQLDEELRKLHTKFGLMYHGDQD